MDAEELRRARREFIRRHHPDVGGDPRVFAAGLTAYDLAVRRALVPRAPLPAPAATVARLAGRWLRDWQALPREVGAAYREGRDTDD